MFHGVFGLAWLGFGANPAAGMFKNLEQQGAQAAGQYGSAAAGEGANLNAFDLARMRETNAFSPQAIGMMQTDADRAAGGALGGIEGVMKANAARTGNDSSLNKSLLDLAMQRGKLAAGTSEGIAAKNAEQVKADQAAGAAGLQGLYGTNVGAQLGSMKAGTEAAQGYMQAQGPGILGQVEGIINTGANAATAAAKF
jgi:hypothetical protein